MRGKPVCWRPPTNSRASQRPVVLADGWWNKGHTAGAATRLLFPESAMVSLSLPLSLVVTFCSATGCESNSMDYICHKTRQNRPLHLIGDDGPYANQVQCLSLVQNIISAIRNTRVPTGYDQLNPKRREQKTRLRVSACFDPLTALNVDPAAQRRR